MVDRGMGKQGGYGGSLMVFYWLEVWGFLIIFSSNLNTEKESGKGKNWDWDFVKNQ